MEAVIAFLPFWLGGLPVTLGIAAAALGLTIPVALLLALGRTSRHKWIAWPTAWFVEFFRGTSALVQLFWAFYVLPLMGIELSAELTGIVVLGLNTGSYFSEIVRSGFGSIPQGQRDASVALHLSPLYTLFHVLIPQALAVIMPPFGNTVIMMVKFTSLLSVITVQDLAYRTGAVRLSTSESVVIFTAALIVYFVISLMLSRLNGLLEKRVDRWVGRPERKLPALFALTPKIPVWALPRGGVVS